MLDITALLDLVGHLGLFEMVKTKLLRQPDAADEKLVAALDEIEKIFTTIDAELSRYLNVQFDSGEHMRDARAVLIELEGGRLWARLDKARCLYRAKTSSTMRKQGISCIVSPLTLLG